MLHVRHPSWSVRTILATSVRVHPYDINALVLLSSGTFAFVGAMQIPESDSEEENGNITLFNVVAATSLLHLEEKAVQLIVSGRTTRDSVRARPWYLGKDAVLRIFFCHRGLSFDKCVDIPDPFLPLASNLSMWQSDFTRHYFDIMLTKFEEKLLLM